MKERPILFSAPMVRALLAGTKTQTRRILTRQPDLAWRGGDANGRAESLSTRTPGARPWWNVGGLNGGPRCPYGAPGDRLWVRESWARTRVFGSEFVVYREGDNRTDYGGPWKPSIHMARRDSRITLDVVGVRVERLHDISEKDAIAEGVTPKREPGCSGRLMEALGVFSFRPAASAYADLWESLNGAGSWAANPWVWVVEFKRTESPND